MAGLWVPLWMGCAPPDATEPAVDPPSPAVPAIETDPAQPVEDSLSRVNFVVFDIDSLRADRLEGGPGPPPNLRWLQARGTLFSRVYPPAGWTLPSVVSMLAGRVAPPEALLPETHPTHHRLLPGILGAYGYHTGVAWGDTLLARHPRRLSWLTGADAAVDYGTAGGFADALARGAVKEPFFVLLHDEDLHTTLMGRHLTEVGPAQAQNLARQRYQQALVDYDRSIGAVLQASWDSGIIDRTVFIVTSDHGEALYEHGELGHGDLLWEEVARVPLLIVDPQVRGGTHHTAAVSTLDLAPTLLQRAGVPLHAEMQGRSLLAVLNGQARPPNNRAFVLDSDLEAAAVIVGDHKLVVHPHGCPPADRVDWPRLQGAQCVALFDLQSDPTEQHNRAAQQPDTLATLTVALETGLQARETPALEEYAAFLSELQQRGYWEAATPTSTPPPP